MFVFLITVLLFLLLLRLDTTFCFCCIFRLIEMLYSCMTKFCSAVFVIVAGIGFSACSMNGNRNPFTGSNGKKSQLFELNLSTDSVNIEAEKDETLFYSATDLPAFKDGIMLGSMLYSESFAIDVIKLPDCDSAYLILAEFNNRDGKGNTYWRLADSLKVHFPDGAVIGWPGYVMKGEVPEPETMVLLPEDRDWVNTEIYYDIISAWKFDREKKRIYGVGKDSLICMNETFGAD